MHMFMLSEAHIHNGRETATILDSCTEYIPQHLKERGREGGREGEREGRREEGRELTSHHVMYNTHFYLRLILHILPVSVARRQGGQLIATYHLKQ